MTEKVKTRYEFWDRETGQLMGFKEVEDDIIDIGIDMVLDFNAPSAPSDEPAPKEIPSLEDHLLFNRTLTTKAVFK